MSTKQQGLKNIQSVSWWKHLLRAVLRCGPTTINGKRFQDLHLCGGK